MPSWPQWRPPFFREDHGGLHADDVSEPHGDSGCDHLCVAGVKCGAIIEFQQIPSRWWTSTASRNGRRHAGAPHCSGGAVLHQPRNSHVRESSFFSRVDTSFNLFFVQKKNIIELLDIALCVRCCTGVASAARRGASAQLRHPRPSQENAAESDCRTPCACCGSASKTARRHEKKL